MKDMCETGAFDHILCWVDGSDEACRAAERAASLAKSLGADLSFLAIGDESAGTTGLADYIRIEGISDPLGMVLETGVKACFDQAGRIAARVDAHPVAHVVLSGHKGEAICEAARMQGADLVVIGESKPGPLRRMATASLSKALTSRCDFAVLSVR